MGKVWEKYGTITGISRKSALFELRSLHFPRSFLVDLMHLVLLNVAPTLYRLWNRTKLSIDKANHAKFDHLVLSGSVDGNGVRSRGSKMLRVSMGISVGYIRRTLPAALV